MENDNKYAVIDLGTNTFHLLAVQREEDGFRHLFKERVYVRLAEDGIGAIGTGAFERGLAAMHQFQKTLDKHGIRQVRAFGTAALRTASNSGEFAEQVAQETGILVEIIPGEEEARLIHQGVMRAVGDLEGRFLIMDIGGGSVEFIIAEGEERHWSRSFPVGVAVLRRRFHQNEPIIPSERERLNAFLEETLHPLLEALAEYPTDLLVGASSAFDVLSKSLPRQNCGPACYELDLGTFAPFYQKVVDEDLQGRMAMKSIPNTRADMIVVALELVRFILERAGTRRVLVSEYAMKEGILKGINRSAAPRFEM